MALGNIATRSRTVEVTVLDEVRGAVGCRIDRHLVPEKKKKTGHACQNLCIINSNFCWAYGNIALATMTKAYFCKEYVAP